MSIGDILKQARISRGLTLDDVEAEIKIRRLYIHALEEERFDVLPGPVYARAFLKTYTRFLGITLTEEEPLQEGEVEVKEEPPKKTPEPLLPIARTKSNDSKTSVFLSRIITGVTIILGLGFLLLVGSWFLGNYLSEDIPVNYLPEEIPYEDIEMPIEFPLESESPQVAPERLNLELKVIDKRCWMLVTVDGNEEFQGTLEPGQSRSFEAEERINVRFGVAGAVEAILNGKNLGRVIAADGSLDHEFTLDNLNSN